MNVTVIGLGPMGQAIVGALLDTGHEVTVWNRTRQRAAGVLERGAHWAETPGDAVRAGGVTLINVIDKTVVDTIVSEAGDAVSGQEIIGLASDAPEKADRAAHLVAELGGRYLDGAIMTPINTIGTPEASILFAGELELYETHRPVLDALGETTWVGESITLAAGFDMALLDLFWTATAGYLHALELAQHAGITPTEFLPHALGIVDILPAIFTDAAERVEQDRHDEATSSLISIANSVRHLIAASGNAGLDTSALTAFARHVGDAIEEGRGDLEATAVSQRVH